MPNSQAGCRYFAWIFFPTIIQSIQALHVARKRKRLGGMEEKGKVFAQLWDLNQAIQNNMLYSLNGKTVSKQILFMIIKLLTTRHARRYLIALQPLFFYRFP